MQNLIALVLLAALAGILAYAATKPNRFRVERSLRIHAPPATILNFINDFHRWQAWSPYEKKDLALKRGYSGPESGKGAVYTWEGNKNVGKGRMEILEVTPAKTTIKLDFIAPFKANNMAEFLLVPEDGITTVTWAVFGPQPYFSKLMSTFCDMDEMIGKDFEAGLVDLKRTAEAGA